MDKPAALIATDETTSENTTAMSEDWKVDRFLDIVDHLRSLPGFDAECLVGVDRDELIEEYKGRSFCPPADDDCWL